MNTVCFADVLQTRGWSRWCLTPHRTAARQLLALKSAAEHRTNWVIARGGDRRATALLIATVSEAADRRAEGSSSELRRGTYASDGRRRSATESWRAAMPARCGRSRVADFGAGAHDSMTNSGGTELADHSLALSSSIISASCCVMGQRPRLRLVLRAGICHWRLRRAARRIDGQRAARAVINSAVAGFQCRDNGPRARQCARQLAASRK